MGRRGFESISIVLKRLVKKLGIEKQLSEKTIFSVWDEVAGAQIAANAKPQNIVRGKLYVNVPSSAHIQEYSFIKKKLIEKLNEKLGKNFVREIVFKVGK